MPLFKSNLTLGVLATLATLGAGSCRTNSSGHLSDTTGSTASLIGYARAGKGFRLLTREVSESQCVLNDTPDEIPPTPDDDHPNPDPDPPTTGGGFHFPWQPIGNPEADVGSAEPFLSSMAKPSRGAGPRVALASEASLNSQPVSTSVSEQGGSAAVELFYLNTTSDVRSAIDATYSDASTATGSVDAVAVDVASNIESALNLKYSTSSEKVYILIHGIKSFPVRSEDVVINPKFNPRLNNLVFGNEYPSSEDAAVKTYETFRKQCGDSFIESVVRGREVWMVAAMEKSVFEASVGGSVGFSTKAGIKGSSMGEATKEMKASIKTDNGVKFLNEKVDVLVRSRGKSDMTVGNFTVADAMERLNQILAAAIDSDEGVIEIKTRRYNNVNIAINGSEKRFEDIFTPSILARFATDVDIIAKLGAEKLWAQREEGRLWSTYGWDQWSLDSRFHNGIAKQFKGLVAYRKNIERVMAFCGSSISDARTASHECLEKVRAAIAIARPVITPPTPYTHDMNVWFSPDVIATAERSTWASGQGQVTQVEARNNCQKTTGWALPDADNWKRIVEASLYYMQWQKDQNPGYRATSDTRPISYPCGRFQSGTFWTDEDRKVVRVSNGCDSAAVAAIPVPGDQKFTSWIFWTQERARYGCVQFKEKTIH